MPTYVPKFRQHVIVLRIRPFVIKKTSTQQGPKTRCPKGPLHHPFYYRLGMTKLKLKKVDWVLGIYPIPYNPVRWRTAENNIFWS